MRRIAVYLIPIVILVGLIVWRLGVNARVQAAQARAAQARKSAPPVVQVTPAVVRDIVHLFQGIGNVEAPQSVRLSPKITGRITYLQAREGDPVHRGEVLVRIDPSEVQAAVSQQQAAVQSAQASATDAQVRYERTYRLYKQGFIAAQDVDDARAQATVQRSAVNAARAQLRNVEAQLGDTILRSPLDGFVTARSLDPGSVVTAGEATLTVEAIRQVYLTTSVPESLSGAVHEGMQSRADFDALPGRTFTGRVTHVSPAADPLSRQFLVRITLDNPYGIIKPGMYGRATVVTRNTRNAVVIPAEAIHQERGGATVVVVDAQRRAHRRLVQTGDRDAAGVAITEGVAPGELVVVLSAQMPRDGQLVRIERTDSRAARAGQPDVQAGGGASAGGAPAAGGGAPAPSYGGTSGVGGSGASVPGANGMGTPGTGTTPGAGNATSSGGTTASPSGGSTGGSGAPTGTSAGGLAAPGAGVGPTGGASQGGGLGAPTLPGPGVGGGTGTLPGGPSAWPSGAGGGGSSGGSGAAGR